MPHCAVQLLSHFRSSSATRATVLLIRRVAPCRACTVEMPSAPKSDQLQQLGVDRARVRVLLGGEGAAVVAGTRHDLDVRHPPYLQRVLRCVAVASGNVVAS